MTATEPGSAKRDVLSRADVLDRVLGALCWLLPAHRADWGQAMRAELSTIAAPAERRTFAAGCARAVLTMPSVIVEVVARVLVIVASLAIIRRFSAATPAVFAETVAVLLMLGLLSWYASRKRPIRSGKRGLLAPAARVVGQLVVLAVLGWFLSPLAGGAVRDPGGWWLAGLSVTLCWAAVLTLTSTETSPRALLTIAGLTAAAVGLWAAQSRTVISPQSAFWPVILVTAAGLVAWVMEKQAGDRGQPARAMLGTASAAAVGTFGTAAVLAVIDPSPAVEPMDPMVAVLIVGAALSTLLLIVIGFGKHALASSDHQPVGTASNGIEGVR